MFKSMFRGSGNGGGGNPHDLGFFATVSELQTAYPTGNAGDYALVGETDTFWVWDTQTSAWIDSDRKGQVTSVNNQTGAVTLTASDVGALPSNTHIPADQVNADWNANSGVAEILNKPTLGTMAAESADDYTKTANLATVATTGEYSDLSGTPTIPDPTQVSTLPTASADELGNIYQFVGTTDANYTNGYFYKCVSDGQTPATYSWIRVDVQPAPVIPDPLPSQTGNAGKFLTTNGTDASWADITSTPATMPTLAVADWSNNTQIVNVTGVTATNTVFVSPAPASAADYASAGIVCTAQGAGTLTFTCTTVPSNAITVNVVCL